MRQAAKNNYGIAPGSLEEARAERAAPQMLAALKRVERSLTELGAKGEPLKTIRAAINAAEGN